MLTAPYPPPKCPTAHHGAAPHAWELGGRGGDVRDKRRPELGRAAASVPVGDGAGAKTGNDRGDGEHLEDDFQSPNADASIRQERTAVLAIGFI